MWKWGKQDMCERIKTESPSLLISSQMAFQEIGQRDNKQTYSFSLLGMLNKGHKHNMGLEDI